MVVSKISSSFTVTIPQEIRLAINLQPGDALEFFIQENGTIVLKKEAAYSHNSPQVALGALELVYEDEEEEEIDEEETAAMATFQLYLLEPCGASYPRNPTGYLDEAAPIGSTKRPCR